MTNSMIPYSFIPGTKAKASEVNANFIALADLVNLNKAAVGEDVEKIHEILETKADKTELINEFTVNEADTDLDDYKTKGTYIFTALYTPLNIPKDESGTLIVTGDTNSIIKQIWFCDGEDPEIFTRDYQNSTWGNWYSINGSLDDTDPELGHLKLANGVIIQWGYTAEKTVTYPIAYTTWSIPILTKNGYNSSYERSDGGISDSTLTGFTFSTAGKFNAMYWLAIGR